MDKTFESVQISLIATSHQIIEGTDTEIDVSATNVWARHGKATRSEHYAAEQSGHRVDDVFVVYSWEYANQPYLTVGTDRYAVVRTYQKNAEFVELSCERLSE